MYSGISMFRPGENSRPCRHCPTGVALDYQAGTNIRNLNVPRYLGREMRMPSFEAQRQIGDTADALQEALLRAEDARDAVANLRSSLLYDLLMGRHEIPATYDRLLDGAA